jgi:hypothetical protein
MAQEQHENRLPGEPPLGYSDVLQEHAANPPEQKTTGESFTAFGQDWFLSNDEMRLRAQLENHVKQEAQRAIGEMRDMDPDQYRAMLAAYVADRAAGSYTWDGYACLAFRQSMPGVRYQFYLMLRRCHPDIDEPRGRITQAGQAFAAKLLEEAGTSAVLAYRYALGNPLTSTRTSGEGNGHGTEARKMKPMPTSALDD